jgi:hypothetical protein
MRSRVPRPLALGPLFDKLIVSSELDLTPCFGWR